MTISSFCVARFVQKRFPAGPGSVAVAAAVLLGSAQAAPGDPGGSAVAEEGLKFRLGQSLTWDDNLFRLPDGQEPADGGPRGTRMSQTRLGLSFDHRYSLQRVAAALTVVDRSYSDHSDLNATTTDGALIWKWASGHQWSGRLGLTQTEAPRSFADTLLRRDRSINTLRQADAEADYLWHPSWSTVAGASQTWSRYSDRQSAASEYDETAVQAGVGFRPASGNRLDLVARYADGDYTDRHSSALATGYAQRDLRLQGDWQFTGHSRFSGYVATTRRTYSGKDRLNFTGPTGRLVYDWEPTGKLALRTTVRRELGSQDEAIDNFVISRTVTVEPRWMLTSKVMAWGIAEWLKRDLGQDPQTVDDDAHSWRYGLGVTYHPQPSAALTAAYQHAWRTASQPQLEYTDDTVRLDLRLEF